MQLLYTRAPIYFEMGDLKAWRGDCSQMVKMAPTDSRVLSTYCLPDSSLILNRGTYD